MTKFIYFFIMSFIFSSCSIDKNKLAEREFAACEAAEKAYNDNSTDALFDKAKEVFAEYFAKNINTPFAQKVFSETKWTRRLSQEQLQSVVDAITDEAFKQTETFDYAKSRLDAMTNAQPGHPFINIISETPDGTPVELADYAGKGKYVLLDFWASWCPDCRKEMPDLVRLYDTFKGDRFEMVGYSLDRKADAWKKGIEDLNISWIQMSDLGYWDSKGAKQYAVQWIPTSVLIDPDGQIIARNLSLDELFSLLDGKIQQ